MTLLALLLDFHAAKSVVLILLRKFERRINRKFEFTVTVHNEDFQTAFAFLVIKFQKATIMSPGHSDKISHPGGRPN
ncbi:uncharacterized protein N7529_009514 [Penicillium soppii]|uniref:uncharacterized protein n=1 Tax=Penicillium soppii TaxID=69789 RepID=UPI002547504D|nr:uncharacterized protein N7529_009514 [Penicillium soppii]KAJ5855570.1 hypothetical protein N7529_009514 [Penicillium soppii]